jgi:hypothetical protein
MPVSDETSSRETTARTSHALADKALQVDGALR